MHSRFTQSIAALVIGAFLLTGCAGVPKRSLNAEQKQSLKSVVIIQPNEPKQYMVLGAANVPGGFMLYMFGALGGLVLGSVEAGRMQAQADNLTAAVGPYKPQIGATITESLREEFERRGVSVSVVPAPPLTQDEKGYDYTAVNASGAQIIEPVITVAGYRKNDGSLKPMVGARVRVLDGATKQEQFLDLFLYGDKLNDNFQTIPADAGASHADIDALFSAGQRAAGELRAAAKSLAPRMVASIRD